MENEGLNRSTRLGPLNDAGTSSAGLWNRRRFVKGLATLGSAGLLGLDSMPAGAEPPPETTRLRLIDDGTICIAPMFVAEALLKSEGFTDVRYIRIEDGTQTQRMAAGDADLGLNFAVDIATRLDAGDPVLALAGVHPGCIELFATDRVRAIRDLKDKTVRIASYGTTAHLLVASMVAYVGLDPRKDIHWVEYPYSEVGAPLHRWQDRRLSGLSAHSAGAAGAADRARGGQHVD